MEDSMNDVEIGRTTVYTRRWYMVFVLWWLNVTNGMLWISYANISDKTALNYGTTVDNVNWLSIIFPVITIFFGLPCIWALDHLGIRISFNICAILNLLSSTLRLLCASSTIATQYKFTVAMIGQFLAALAQPIAMFSPARLAFLWFAPHQRVIATTLTSLGNPFGVLLGSLLPPIMYKTIDGFTHLAILLFALALVGAFISLLGICRSEPRHPPSISFDRHSLTYSFVAQLRLCLANKSFIILALSFGVALGFFSALSTLIEQILCPYGYSPTFAGECGALLIGCGLIGALISGIIADKTKALTEIIQFCFVLATFGIIVFSVLSTFSNMNGGIIASVCWIGTFGVALYSVCFEIAAEITFPASENVSTGLLVVSGQIFSVLFILLSLVLTSPINIFTVPIKCSSPSDRSFWVLNMVLSAFAVISAMMLLLFFFPSYRRRSMESALISAQEDYGRESAVSVSE